MENAQTIKVSLQSLEIPAIGFYVHAISLLLTLFLIKKIFGQQIKYCLLWIITSIKGIFNRKSHPDWIAKCVERKNWPQKQDALSLDLKGQYLKNLSFAVTLTGQPQHWRAGFVLGNEKLMANKMVDNKNGILIHTGSDYDKKEKILPIWKYYDDFSNNNPDFSSVKSENIGERIFSVDINNENFMTVKVQNEVIFAQRINSSFRRRVYLKAWVDTSPDCAIKFKRIKYTLWS